MVSLIGRDGRQYGNFGENFRFGYLRSSTGNGQYYRLGRYHAANEFAGYLQYQSTGNWKPAYDGAIVLRRHENVELPVKSIYIFVLGLFGLLLGIGTVLKLKHGWLPAAGSEGMGALRNAHLNCELLKNQDSLPN